MKVYGITQECCLGTDPLGSAVPVFSAKGTQFVGLTVTPFVNQSGKRKTMKEVNPLTSTSKVIPQLVPTVDLKERSEKFRDSRLDIAADSTITRGSNAFEVIK